LVHTRITTGIPACARLMFTRMIKRFFFREKCLALYRYILLPTYRVLSNRINQKDEMTEKSAATQNEMTEEATATQARMGPEPLTGKSLKENKRGTR
jgi:hypothetical protein